MCAIFDLSISRIFDRLQDEAFGWRRGPCFARAIAGKTSRNGRGVYIPAAGFDQRPGHIPHHMLEETAPADRIDQRVPGARQFRTEDPANPGFFLVVTVIRSGKGREIMLAFEDPGGLDHRAFIERIWVMVHVSPLERRTDRRAEQRVPVGLADGVESGMKAGLDFNGVQNPDRRRQQTVDGALQISHWDRVRNGKSRDLSQRVNAGIGASGSGDMNRFAFHGADDFFEHALDRRQARLHLPSVELSAVVSQRNADAA